METATSSADESLDELREVATTAGFASIDEVYQELEQGKFSGTTLEVRFRTNLSKAIDKCEWCGQEPYIERCDDTWRISCDTPTATCCLGASSDLGEAIKMWNKMSKL